MKSFIFLYLGLTIFGFATNECAYFINKIGVYKNNKATINIRNKHLNSTEKLIFEYQYGVEKKRLKKELELYLSSLKNIEDESYIDISPLCINLKKLSTLSNQKKRYKVKNHFFKKILFNFKKYYYQYRKKAKKVYVKGCEPYANVVSKLILKYHKKKNYNKRIEKSINIYERCKYVEYRKFRKR